MRGPVRLTWPQALLGPLLLLLLSLAAGGAEARNVPGSASAVSMSLAEDAAGMLSDDISAVVTGLRAGTCAGAGPVVTASSGDGGVEGLAATLPGGGGTQAASGLRHRSIERDDVRYDLSTGFVLGAHCIDSRLLAFGGVVFERGQGEIGFSDGTLDHDGQGLTFGLDYAVDDRLSLSAILGRMWLDYDFTRGGGANRGSFGADRTFVNLSGQYGVTSGVVLTSVSGGLRWVSQTNEAHVESGGGAVPEARAEVLSALLGARSTFRLGGAVDPFVEIGLRRDLSSSDNLPEALDEFGEDATHARLGIGAERRGRDSNLEAGLGATFDDGSYTGLDGYLRWTLRF